MFATAYDTLACRYHDRAAIERGLEYARIEGMLLPAITPYHSQKVKHVYRLAIDDEQTPAFTQPYCYTNGDRDPTAYVIDARLFFNINANRTLTLTNADEYTQQIKRAVLTHYWNAQTPGDLLRVGDLPPLVFCRWIAGVLSRRFGLGPLEQSKATIVAYAYWLQLHASDDQSLSSEKWIMKTASRLGQLTAIPATVSLDVLQQLDSLQSIQALTTALTHTVGSARLEKLTPAILYAMLGGSWFGLNNRETVGVALEHPPTFLSLIDAGLTSRNYRQSIIGRLVHEYDRRERGRVFLKTVQSLVSTYFEER
jgi:hypothetical protein